MDECKHPNKPHTIWWWIEDKNDPVPVPYSSKFDNRKDAMTIVNEWISGPPHVSFRWVKVFRSDNENYTCFHWENPEPLPIPPVVTPELTYKPKKKRWWRR